jgi:flavin-dependent dehydrogenase
MALRTAIRSSYDVVVIGGGPAGASAAIALADAGWSVAVVERKEFPRRKVCGEFISAAGWPLLRELGVAAPLLADAGPEVRQVGFYGGATRLRAQMPAGADGWGRAIGRERLDTLLLRRAAEAGAEVWQPCTLESLERNAGGFLCTVLDRHCPRELQARIVIAAHGSWEPGTLPTQDPRVPARPSDLFAFKAHFLGAALPAGLMPLLVFPGGYGGMVHTDSERVSLSCCLRRDMLERCRARTPDARAGDAVLAHIRASCRGVEEALAGATREGAWLSAGPIRPGRRTLSRDGIYAIGNAAGEAHPIVAEGISMAIQSAALLCAALGSRKAGVLSGEARAAAGCAYALAWHRNFVTRIRAAALFAQLAVRPATGRAMGAALEFAPAILTLAAAWSGKARPLRRLQPFDAA